MRQRKKEMDEKVKKERDWGKKDNEQKMKINKDGKKESREKRNRGSK
jgi:hypothetical protein